MRCAKARILNASGPIVVPKPPAVTPEKLLSDLRRLHSAGHYALAVSGGRDSMGLLAMAAQAAVLPEAPKFSVLTVDHGLRAEARNEALMVAKICADLGLPHHILQADEGLGVSDIQQKARHMRYRLMAGFCREQKAPLVTAHHMNDQAETIAMRLARGSGVDGLAGMAQKQWLETAAGRILLLRPLLEADPADICSDLPHADDPSNDDVRFERVRWRQHMPHMSEAGMSPPVLAAFARDMRRLRDGRRNLLRAWLAEHGDWHTYGVLALPRAALLELPVEMRDALLSACVRYFGRHGFPPRRSAVSAFAEQIGEAISGAAVLGGVLMRWRKTTVFLGREYAAMAPAGTRACVGALWDGRFQFVQRPDGHIVAPLGTAGVAALRDKGIVFDATLPAAYHAVLPALFSKGAFSDTAPLALATEKYLRCVSSEALFDALLELGQDW